MKLKRRRSRIWATRNLVTKKRVILNARTPKDMRPWFIGLGDQGTSARNTPATIAIKPNSTESACRYRQRASRSFSLRRSRETASEKLSSRHRRRSKPIFCPPRQSPGQLYVARRPCWSPQTWLAPAGGVTLIMVRAYSVVATNRFRDDEALALSASSGKP